MPPADDHVQDIKVALAAPERQKALGLRDRAIMEAASSTGLTVAQILLLVRTDLRLKLNLLRSEGSVFPLSPKAVAAIRDYLDHGRPLLVNEDHPKASFVFLTWQGRRLEAESYVRFLARLMRIAAVDGEQGNESSIVRCTKTLIANGAA